MIKLYYSAKQPVKRPQVLSICFLSDKEEYMGYDIEIYAHKVTIRSNVSYVYIMIHECTKNLDYLFVCFKNISLQIFIV